jgi:hypothetical protein
LKELIYHPGHNSGRLALYFLRLLQDVSFAKQELTRISNSHRTDFSLQRHLPTLYALSVTEDKEVAERAYDYLQNKYKTKSPKLKWHRDILLKTLNWYKDKQTTT